MVEYEEYNEDLKFMYESRDLKFMIESASYKELEFAAKVLDFVWGAVKMELKGQLLAFVRKIQKILNVIVTMRWW